MIIGLTGKRHVGKSKAADFLVDAGFERAHPFAGGKIASIAYFQYLGASHDEARSMAHGDLRDRPCDLLPGGVTPRYWMERFGRFMGVEMGSEWTLGAELARIIRHSPEARVVVESLVYEAPLLRAAGGIIVRITRPGHKGVVGERSDAAQVKIDADIEIVNDGTLDDLRRKIMTVAGL